MHAFWAANSGQFFQKLMDSVLQGLSGVFCYLDNILVASVDEQQHLQHPRALFQCLQQFGLVLNVQKCLFGMPSVEFLGHTVDANGAKLLADKVEVVKAMHPPSTVKQPKAFLDMINFNC